MISARGQVGTTGVKDLIATVIKRGARSANLVSRDNGGVPPRKCLRGCSKHPKTDGRKRERGTLHACCTSGGLNNPPSDPGLPLFTISVLSAIACFRQLLFVRAGHKKGESVTRAFL